MRCSWSEALRRILTPRLATALAVSAALHALIVGALDTPASPPRAAAEPLRALVLHGAGVQERPAPQASREAAAPPRYYRTSELDVVPGIMTRVNPDYPELVHVGGSVTIRLFIDERGTVEHVAVLRAEPRGYFEASARRAFMAARFSPAMKNGVPVKAQITLQVDYSHPR